MSQLRTPDACVVEDGFCQSYLPGHNMHFIHANHLGRTPWGWRDGVVEAMSGGWLRVRYIDVDGAVDAWHHDDLTGELGVGDPLRVHEQYYSLRWRGYLLNVRLRGGVGAVLEPVLPEVWAQEVQAGVVDLATGRGVPVDDPDEE